MAVTGGVTLSWDGVVVKGGMTINGDAYLQTAVITSSDRRLKTNIHSITDGALEKVLRLRGVYFNWKNDREIRNTEDLSQLRDKEDGPISRVGVIAQDVEQVIPEAVHQSIDTTLSVSYDQLIPVITKAIQELDDKVNTYIDGKSIHEEMIHPFISRSKNEQYCGLLCVHEKRFEQFSEITQQLEDRLFRLNKVKLDK
jgi:hypothetical protein